MKVQCVVSRSILTMIVFSCAILFWQHSHPWTVRAQSCPSVPVVNISSPQTPVDVCIPDGFGGNPIQFFDDYSWRAFISMVWPAASGRRGMPDTSKDLSTSNVPLVFETLKSDWEVFQPMGAAPAPATDPPAVSWNKFAGTNPCGSPVGFDDLVLASFSKFGDLGEAGDKKQNPLVHALPAQNGTWVRYLTSFNQVEYTQIVNGKLYLVSSLQKPVVFQSGALDVKSAWVDMTGFPAAQAARYYKRSALVKDPSAQPGAACTSITVGLVGLHIVQKTPSRPQWIWSSFEQVDNVPGTAGVTGPFGFNDGKGTASPLQATPLVDPNGGFPPNDFKNPKIYNVVRVQPIHTSTQTTNTHYQQALAGTVWRFYELVMTQWPLQKSPPAPIPPSQNGLPANTFPGVGANTSFSNTTLETWDQNSVFTGGCMACHTKTQSATDFLWSVEINAFDPKVPANSMMALTASRTLRKPRSKPERELMDLLRSSSINKK